ncbi:hypothetical protein N9097_00170 [bacterium]|nr:hypothetical protein [Akkermansiaceae bacterium]MDB4532175.1 hypothetical protein [bacterium]MDB4330677.1 hypothetical protein [Akkermansiaceae bacterium]MDB4333954.1 hypothetical protein [Akkermansiaceae bacterium]MDB4584978.1 hypothetical protein [bacterium]
MILAEGIDGQVIVVVLMVLFAGAKALIEKLQKKGAPPVEYETGEDEEDDAYEEYARQLEARRQEILVRQQQASAPPPLPAERPINQQKVYVQPTVTRAKLSKAEQEALANLQRNSTRKPRSKKAEITTARARARRVLASPHAARDAIVLSEILGTPKGMR